MNKNNKMMLYLLIASSVVMFASIFSMSYRILGIGLLQWVIIVAISFASVWRVRITAEEFIDYNHASAVGFFKQRKYGRAALYFSVVPLMGVGVLMVSIMIISAIVIG